MPPDRKNSFPPIALLAGKFFNPLADSPSLLDKAWRFFGVFEKTLMTTIQKNSPPGPTDPGSVGYTRPRSLRIATEANPLPLDCGRKLGPVTIEYEIYGEMNADKSNVILVTHALSGDAHAAGWDSTAVDRGLEFRVRKPGWWDGIIGPGKCLDTTRYCVVCSNVVGSCYGSTGPSSNNPATGKPYGLQFPMITVGDWVRAQARLFDHLGVQKLLLVIGGSLGGQQALEWGLAFPDRVANIAVLASAASLNPIMIGINAIARHGIFNDPAFQGGNYYGSEKKPEAGLAGARMMGHLTFLAHPSTWQKFGRERVRGGTAAEFTWETEFQIESYLKYQAANFLKRFDANSYLYITKAMDYYDAAAQWGNGDLAAACRRLRARCLVMSFGADWMYTPEESRQLAHAMQAAGAQTTLVETPSTYGHDAFLVELDDVNRTVRDFLNS